jgi:mycofactocin precursor
MAPDEHVESEETSSDTDDVVMEDLLVEDVSIDGMCGVY